MNLYDTTFLLSFILALSILGYRLINVMNSWLDRPLYEITGMIVSFCAYCLCWFFCLAVVLHEPTETLFATLLYLVSWGLVLNVLFLISDVMFMLRRTAIAPIKAHQTQTTPVRAYSPERGR